MEKASASVKIIVNLGVALVNFMMYTVEISVCITLLEATFDDWM
jgi:hypothetical protein